MYKEKYIKEEGMLFRYEYKGDWHRLPTIYSVKRLK